MTGAYTRIERGGKCMSIEIEYLTDEEREELFYGKHGEELLRWINLLCHYIKEEVCPKSM